MITTTDTSERFRVLLAKAGWFPERRVETKEWVAQLEREGFVPNAIAVSVIESFGGLVVPLPPAGISPYAHELHFDPVAAATGEYELAEGWKDQIGADLFPVGEEVKVHSVIWAGSDGTFYIGRDFGLYRLGGTLAEAMDQLAFPTIWMPKCAD